MQEEITGTDAGPGAVPSEEQVEQVVAEAPAEEATLTEEVAVEEVGEAAPAEEPGAEGPAA